MSQNHRLYSHGFSMILLGLTILASAHGRSLLAQDIKIPQTTFMLSNGLTVIISEDHSTPTVAVELWLRAGARYEERGRWGEAHFCEHLLGATRVPLILGRILEGNAQTRRDFTRYYALVPREALEYVLAGQADRLDYPLAAMTAKRLADNRDIVINEFRAYESHVFDFGSPTDVKLLVNGFGSTHPYGRPLQLNQDIATISDADMRLWIAEHTLPSEAFLLLVGDVSVAETRGLIEKYFGPIQPSRAESPSLRSRIVNEPIQPTPQRRERMVVDTPAGRILSAWATPPYGSPEADYLSLFIEVFAAPEVGRLYHRLVSLDGLASATFADAQQEELAGAIRATVILKPRADPLRAESAFIDEVDRLARDGPTDDELRAAKARTFTKFAKRVERLGWQGSRLEILGEGALYRGDANAYRSQLDRIARASREDIMRVAQTWVSHHGYVLNACPQPGAATTATIDRTKPITLPPTSPPAFAAVSASQLPNGMKIGLVARRGSLVNVTAVIPLPPDWGIEDGAWIVAQSLVDRDPTNHSPRAELWRQCLASGCELIVTTDSTAVTVAVETLASNRETALKAVGSLFTTENLNVEAMNRAVAAWQVSHDSQDAAARANQMLGRILGGGDPETTITPPDENHLDPLRKSIFNSGRATILVAGDIEPQRVETAVKQFFITLPPSEMIRRLTDTKAERKLNTPQRFVVYFMDAPGRAQALILAGQRLGELTAETLLKARLAAAIVGARVNANLREQHQWSYGAQARLGAAFDGSAALLLSTEVQTDQTAAAIAEIRRELEQQEPTPSDLTRLPFYRRDMSQQIVGGSATVAGVNAALAELARRRLSLTKYPELLSNASTLDAVSLQEALRLIDPKAVVFVLVGDSVRVRSQLDAAGVTIIPIHQ